MAMSERVSRLRQESLAAVPRISTERAELMTAFYQQRTDLVSEPLHRAQAFQIPEKGPPCRKLREVVPEGHGVGRLHHRESQGQDGPDQCRGKRRQPE